MDWLTPSVPYIVSLQKSAGLLPLMKLFSALGSTEFFLLALPLLYWCQDRTLGWKVGLLVVANATLNDILKIVFGLPRPYWISPVIHQWDKELSFGLPSGHVQGSVVFWIFLALQIRDRKRRHVAVGAACGLAALVAISRFFLGAHFPADAVAGALFGMLFLSLVVSFVLPWGTKYRAMPLEKQVALALAAPVIALLLFWLALEMPHAVDTSGYVKYVSEARGASAIAGRTGALAGLLLGLLFMSREPKFSVAGPSSRKIARFVIGLVGVILIYLGLASVLAKVIPAGATEIAEIGRFVRYFLLAWWIAAGAPLLFLKLNLMQREGPESAIGTAT